MTEDDLGTIAVEANRYTKNHSIGRGAPWLCSYSGLDTLVHWMHWAKLPLTSDLEGAWRAIENHLKTV